MKRLYFLSLIIFNLYSNNVSAQHLFLLAGQSNAVGQGNSSLSPSTKPDQCFEYDASEDRFIPLKDPVGKPWKLFQRAGTGSICPAFADGIHALSGSKVYMVTAARGGASCSEKAEMSNYDTWDTSGALFDMAVEKTKMAEANINLPLSGIIWMQGERDANAILNGQLTPVEYRTALMGVIERFRKSFDKDVPFYIVQTAYQQDKAPDGCRAVRRQQHAVARKLKGVYIAYSETDQFAKRKWFKDNVHYNQDALNHIGRELASFVIRHPGD